MYGKRNSTTSDPRPPWRWFARMCIVAAILISLLSACGPQPESYATTDDQAALAQLLQGNQKLCIVSFTADPTLYTPGGNEQDVNPGFLPVSLEDEESKRARAAEIAEGLASAHLEKMGIEFSQRFQLVGSTEHGAVSQPVTEKQPIAEAIEKAGAEFGLIVYDQFGWDWSAENTGIQSYYFKTCTTFYNSQGMPIWTFCGKGMVLNKPKLSLDDFFSAMAGTAPPLEVIVGDFETFFTLYPQFLLLLMEEDATGTAHGSEIEEYVEFDSRLDRFSVSNADDERFLPHFP